MGAGCSSQPPRRSEQEVEQHARKLSVLAPHERPDPLRAVKLGVDPTALINEQRLWRCEPRVRRLRYIAAREVLSRRTSPNMVVVPQASSARAGSARCIV